LRTHYTDVVLALHGGAGTILHEDLTPGAEEEHRASLAAALRAGYVVLNGGGTALDAVCETVRLLEDDPLFNAGRGAVFTHAGTIELDASVMDGPTRQAGAVAGVTTVRNPVLLARRVLEESPFVFLVGPGAEAFAVEQGIERVPPEYFATTNRRAQWEAVQERERQTQTETVALSEDTKYGTVGAVARDRNGHVAAATSTGGMTNKRHGRIGDSPVIGAGTWADDATCAVSATGHGEFFIRYAVAHDIAARIAYAGKTLAEASEAVVLGVLREVGGAGGVIALDPQGNASLPFNTPGMYRGVVLAGGSVEVAIFLE
jgi:beta-aspartyl-peptidase (threonine type)